MRRYLPHSRLEGADEAGAFEVNKAEQQGLADRVENVRSVTAVACESSGNFSQP